MWLINILFFSNLAFHLILPSISEEANTYFEKRFQVVQNVKNASDSSEIIHTINNTVFWFLGNQLSQLNIKEHRQLISNFSLKKINFIDQLIIKKNKTLLKNFNTFSKNVIKNRMLQVNDFLSSNMHLLKKKKNYIQKFFNFFTNTENPYINLNKLFFRENNKVTNKLTNCSFISHFPFLLTLFKIDTIASKLNKFQTLQDSNNYQKLFITYNNIYKKHYDKINALLLSLNNNLYTERQLTSKALSKKNELLKNKKHNLSKKIIDQMEMHHMLSVMLNNQINQINLIIFQQQHVIAQTLQVHQTLTTIIKQSKWLGFSSILGQALRAQVTVLPKMPHLKKVDSSIIKLRVQHLQLEMQLEELKQNQFKYNNITHIKDRQYYIINKQFNIQSKLLDLLLANSNNQLKEMQKLKLANVQLIKVLYKIYDATHRYLFWVPNIYPIHFSYLFHIKNNLHLLTSSNILIKIKHIFSIIINNPKTLIPIFSTFLLMIMNIISRKYYYAFLLRTSNKIGKVTQDTFLLTLHTVLLSMLVVLPIPILWSIYGLYLKKAWDYQITEAIGQGIINVLPILWLCMICKMFAHPQGLFIRHFRWPIKQINLTVRYYKMLVLIMIPLLMGLITCNSLQEYDLMNSLGRLCFIGLCFSLVLITHRLKCTGIPLYLDKEGSSNNVMNRVLWRILLLAPLIAVFASSIGYLTTSQALLVRLEISVVIWFFLLIIYYVIRRWMLIQRRRIAFDRAKQRRAEILSQRIREGGEEEICVQNNIESLIDIDDIEIDLDAISAQSLQLVRSILTMIALVSVIILWSEIHSAFSFIENISLWNVTSKTNNIEITHPITLGAILIAILILTITMQLLRNLPALLELAVLQHLELAPGTGYAVITITKYLLLVFGSVFSFSWIGIEWSKLQWVITALSLGLGFGMQEIFSNFISGLIILFEKPIRIGDTVTIRNLTGTVTKINTRATTISDWDRKEIIVPNKAFITEQLINWSLSDTLTRVVLTIPAPADVNSEEVTNILSHAATSCSLVLDNPGPEVYLVNLQQGIQIFELRVYVAEMKHRMPLRHEIHQLILSGYKKHNITLPYPPFQVRSELLLRLNNTK
ncbi:Miniconductance mechanosensitive channel MscM [Candidatus Ecksteinia adelgidicola]|nr:Miniconductance mechanosensitive channel MscM [Candidatus Ecksteinia adelgidicola]